MWAIIVPNLRFDNPTTNLKEKERKKKIQEKFEELKAERGVRLEERRKEKEEAAKFGEVPESDGEESEEEPEIELKNVVLSGT